ncbi:RrF2 family transcriptional regulator [Granulibacter bethesdensis]|uniref:RrF2 family transcriptional regulator n=1 Tax=Granulibacter bethesdensis TaxID=364410 RepID=UPI00090CD8F6|nr:Rrf2 family transcriptional regulator [Granulibacter bethesdensis]APH60030.1 Rrf2 family protein [Granulibacter bethesdensis]
MKFTRYTDYAVRVMIYLSVNQDRVVQIAEIARVYDISHNHLMKVVQGLVSAGLVSSVRGRSGGLLLGRPADQITVGELVRRTEDGFHLVECAGCAARPGCQAPSILAEATKAFLAVLDRYTLADVVRDKSIAHAAFNLRVM